MLMFEKSFRRIVAMIVILALLPMTAVFTAPVGAQDEHGMESVVRVMAVDGGTGQLTVLDPSNGEVVGSFTTPTGGYAIISPSATGRYFLASHYEGEHVTIVDSGLSLEAHGDHADLVVATPFLRATVAVGPTPAHVWADDGVLAVHVDGDGKIVLFDESSLPDELVTSEFYVAQPDHAAIAPLGEAMLVGYYGLGRIDAYALDGELLQVDIAACSNAHGEAHFAEGIAFGCKDGLLLVTTDGETFQGEMIPYPGAGEASSTPVAEAEALRIGTLVSHEDNDVLVGDYGNGLALVTDVGGEITMEVLPLPSSPLAFAYDRNGENLVVLTDDGAMHAIDPAAGEILWTTDAVIPYSEVEIGDGFSFYPAITASDTFAYVADAGTGEVLELDLEDGKITNRFAIGGQPARVTLTMASGVVH